MTFAKISFELCYFEVTLVVMDKITLLEIAQILDNL